MNEEQLKLLGLAKDATADQITAALTALKTKSDDAETRLAALKAETATPDLTKYAPIHALAEIQASNAALTAKLSGYEIDAVVKPALEDGRLLPSLEPWARELGKTNVAALKDYLDKAAPIAALKGSQSGGKAPDASNAGTLDDAALAVCRQMGISPEDYKKTLA